MKIAFKVLVNRQDVIGYIVDSSFSALYMPILGHVAFDSEKELYSIYFCRDTDLSIKGTVILIRTWEDVEKIINSLST